MTVGTLFAYALSVLAPLLVQELGLTRSMFGASVSVVLLTASVVAPRLGVLVDKAGGPFSLNVLFLASAASMVLLAASRSFGLLLGAAVVGGLAMALTNSATNHVLAARLPEGQRGWVMGTKQAGAQASAVLAGVALPAGALAMGWRGAVLGLTLLCPVGLFAVWRFLQPRREERTSRAETRHVRGDTEASERVAVRGLTLFAAFMAAGGGMVQTFLPLYTFEQFGVSQSVAGLTTAIVGTVGVVARVVIGPVAERFRRPATPLVLLAVLTCLSVATLWSSAHLGLSLVWVAAFLFGASGAAWNTAAMLALLRLGGAGNVGRLSGTVMSGAYAGGVVSPLLLGLVVDTTGAYEVGWIVALLLLGGAVAMSIRLHSLGL